MKMFLRLKLILVFFLLLMSFSCSHAEKPGEWELADQVEFQIGEVTVSLEVADEPHERERGLSYRKSLRNDHGMLFVFEEPQILQFWMNETYFDLDIAFLNEAGVIEEIYTMRKMTKSIYRSSEKCLYAIELPAGWFRENNVEIGEKVEITRLAA